MKQLISNRLGGSLLGIGIGVALAIALDNIAVGIGVGVVFVAGSLVWPPEDKGDSE